MVAQRLRPLEPPYEPEVRRTLERMMGGSGVTLVGQYHTVGYVTNALGVELESFAPRFPTLTGGERPNP